MDILSIVLKYLTQNITYLDIAISIFLDFIYLNTASNVEKYLHVACFLVKIQSHEDSLYIFIICEINHLFAICRVTLSLHH